MSKRVTVKGVHELKTGQEMELHDLQISASDADGTIRMVDLEIASSENSSDYVIRPGCWKVTPRNGLIHLDIPDEAFFETTTSRELLNHLEVFKQKTQVYRKFNMLPKRGILMGSDAGCGKSSLIRFFCRAIKSDPKICILRIDSQEVSWDTISRMFMREYEDGVELIVLIVEDIGGSELNERRNQVDSEMLNFLDGNTDCIQVPTLVIATTNFLNELGDRLIDRPGRFDVVLEVEPPTDEEIIMIVESFVGRGLTATEKKSMSGKKLTPAYAKESVVRSELYDITIEESIRQLLLQRDKSRGKKHGVKASRLGFDSHDED